MKKLFACLALFSTALAAVPALAQGNDPIVKQYDPTANYPVEYVVAKPSGGANGVLMYDGSALLQFMAKLDSRFVLSGTTLTFDMTGITTSASLSSALASYATTSALTSALAAKFNTPTGTTAQYVRGDGSLATLPSGGGTVTSVGITSSTLSVIGSPVTSSGSMSVDLPTVGTAGTYSSVTTDARGRVTAGTTRSFSSPSRALNTCFQVSSTRDALVSYAVDITTTVTLGGTPEGAVFLRTYTNSGCSAGQVGVISGSNGQPTTLTVSVGQAIKGSVNVMGMVPAGTWTRIETSNVSGTPAFAIRAEQQEALF